MAFRSLYQILEDALGNTAPVAYRAFAAPVTPPFVVYYFVDENDIFADNINYKKKGTYNIELYTERKDPTLEGIIEDALTAEKMTYTKNEYWIDTEKLYQIVYSIEILE